MRIERAQLWFATLMLILSAPARGSYEVIPGPAPGGASSWAWPGQTGPREWAGGVALGRPAEVEGLAWTHAWCGTSFAGVHLNGEAFGLGFENLYREEAEGIWIADRGVVVGLRRWQVSWADGPRRGGWTGSLETTVRRGRSRGRAIAQDLALGRADRAGPRKVLALELSHRVASTVEIAVAARRERAAGGLAWRVRWAPAPAIALVEEVLTPGAFGTGVEVRASRLCARIWVAPVDAIGARTGASLSWGDLR